MSKGWHFVFHGVQSRRPVNLRASLSRGASAFAAIIVLALAACATSASGWQQVGDDSLANAHCLVDDPFVGSVVYSCASHGQVYRWRADKGSIPIGGVGLPGDAAVYAIAPDTRVPGLLYAGASAGFFVSDDRGDSWRSRGAGLPPGDTIGAIASVPGDSPNQSVVYVGTPDSGVFATRDAGHSWAAVSNGLPPRANVDTLYWEPSGRVLFVSLDQGGVFALPAGAHSWTPRGSGLPGPVLALTSITASGNVTVFAGTSAGIFTTGDAGQHWKTSAAPRGHVAALAGNAQHPGWIYAAIDSTVYSSQDAGQTWAAVASPLQRTVAAVVAVDLPRTIAIYSAADHVYRYPPYVPPPSGPVETALTLLAVVGVLAVAIWALVRTRRQLVAMARAQPRPSPGSPAGRPGPENATPSPQDSRQPANTGGAPGASNGDLPSSNGHSRAPR